MPAIFGHSSVKAVGKTNAHVFIGAGAPFGIEGTLKMKHFVMGDVSRTFLVVRAGPDTADVWTKPGGLKFDARDPYKALGNLKDLGFGGGFHAAMADASIRYIGKMVDKGRLKALITLSGDD